MDAPVKTLILMRHGKAQPDDSAASDFERPLRGRGRKDSTRVGRYLAANAALTPQLVLCSPSLRTLQTAELVIAALPSETRLDVRRSLYLASAEAVVDEIGGVDPQTRVVIVIGHNPGLESLARWLAGNGPSRASERLEHGLKTASLACFEVASRHWTELAPSSTVLAKVLWPREDF